MDAVFGRGVERADLDGDQEPTGRRRRDTTSSAKPPTNNGTPSVSPVVGVLEPVGGIEVAGGKVVGNGNTVIDLVRLLDPATARTSYFPGLVGASKSTLAMPFSSAIAVFV